VVEAPYQPRAVFTSMLSTYKTVRIETNVLLFGGNFFSQLDRPSFFQSLGDKNRKTKIRHTETRGNDGRQRRWPNSLPAASRTPILLTKIAPHAKGYIVPCLVFSNFFWGACGVMTVTVRRLRFTSPQKQQLRLTPVASIPPHLIDQNASMGHRK
jgi:hypothetical protein